MPVEIKGLDSTLKAMQKFEPELAKNLNKQLRAAMTPVQKEARALVPMSLSGLSHWTIQSSGKKINAQTSVFATIGHFPKFNSGQVVKGMKIIVGKSKPNRNGFAMYSRIVNSSRAGAIMETAGRTNPNGRPWNPTSKGSGSSKYSHSKNPHAGEWFINHMHGGLKGQGAKKGRLLYRAYAENKGYALNTIEMAMKTTIFQFQQRANANSVWSAK